MKLDPGGRFTAIGISLRNLITLAYGLSDDNLSGAPSWISSATYDIVAKPRTGIAEFRSKEGRAQQMLRLQRLLTDRFQLKMHSESQIRKVLALMVAKSGPKMQRPTDGGGTCSGPAGVLSMTMLSKNISLELGEPVLDQTELTGNFCVGLRWSSDDGRPRAIGRGSASTEGAILELNSEPSIFAALRQQLGLTLQPQKSAVQILVIDHVAEPSPN